MQMWALNLYSLCYLNPLFPVPHFSFTVFALLFYFFWIALFNKTRFAPAHKFSFPGRFFSRDFYSRFVCLFSRRRPRYWRRDIFVLLAVKRDFTAREVVVGVSLWTFMAVFKFDYNFTQLVHKFLYEFLKRQILWT